MLTDVIYEYGYKFIKSEKENVYMFEWLANNFVTIIICAVLIVVVVLIILSMIRDRKKGKSSCGCNCAHCAMAGACHSNKETKGKKQ